MALRSAVAAAQVGSLATRAHTLPGGARTLVASVDGLDGKSIQVRVATLKEKKR